MVSVDFVIFNQIIHLKMIPHADFADNLIESLTSGAFIFRIFVFKAREENSSKKFKVQNTGSYKSCEFCPFHFHCYLALQI